MAKSQETFSKKEKEKARLKKRQDKQFKREENKANPKKSGLQDMIAYVDEYGNLSSTPPDPSKKRVILSEDKALSGCLGRGEHRHCIRSSSNVVGYMEDNPDEHELPRRHDRPFWSARVAMPLMLHSVGWSKYDTGI